VFNPVTQHISPQYHAIFDYKFTTVPSLYSVEQRDETWKQLFELESDEWFVEEDVIGQRTAPPAVSQPRLHQRDRDPNPVPDLDDESEGEVPMQPTMLPAPSAVPHAPVPPAVPHVPVPPPIHPVPEGDASATPPPTQPAPTNAAIPPTPEPEFDAERDDKEESRRYPSQSNVGNWKDGPRKDDVLKEHKGKWKTGLMCLLTLSAFALSAVRDWGQPPPGVNLFGAKGVQTASQQPGCPAR
jgi:hypothetical protein